MTLTRRAALSASAAAILGIWPACAGQAARASRPRVVVVGAGLAGLAAADELARAGFAVTVLEARGRVGGRVHTLRFPDGRHAEAGGEFIDAAHAQMRRYARRFGLGLEDQRTIGTDNPGVVCRGGARRPETALWTPAVERELERFQAALDRLSDELDLAGPAAAALDRRSVAAFLDELELDRTARELIEHDVIRDEYTVEAAELSLLWLAVQNGLGPDAPASDIEAFRIRGGNDRLPRALAHAVRGDVRLGTPVERIATDAHGVRVSAGVRTFRADWCVLAAPLPALRAIELVPGPPPALAAAIAELQYGTATKVALRYRSRVWETAGFSGDTFTDLSVSTTWEATNGQPGPDAVLLAYTAGAPGHAFTALDSRARIAEAAAALERIHPGSERRLVGGGTVAWTRERYTGGTYAAYAPGQVTRFRQVLRRPVGRVVLAGEHTAQLSGYMESALRSGRRAARLLARRAAA